MTFLLVVVAFLILLLAIVIFTRVVLEVDTRTGLFLVRWGRVLGCRIAWNERGPVIVLRTVFWQWQWFLFELKPTARKEKRSVKKQRKARRSTAGMSFFMKRHKWLFRSLRRTLRATDVRHFHWRLDTGDMLWNAQLFPLLHLWRQRGQDVAIDFTGHNALAFQIAHSPARILWAFRPF
jgi:hypothetical protein